MGLDVGWTPHSGRAGFASDCRAEGRPFEEIREAGRWQSDSSLRIYLDIVGAHQILQQFREKGLSTHLRYAESSWQQHFPDFLVLPICSALFPGRTHGKQSQTQNVREVSCSSTGVCGMDWTVRGSPRPPNSSRLGLVAGALQEPAQTSFSQAQVRNYGGSSRISFPASQGPFAVDEASAGRLVVELRDKACESARQDASEVNGNTPGKARLSTSRLYLTDR